jgi:hypothetical protein
MVKLPLCLINYATSHKDKWESEIIAPPLSIPALSGGEWPGSCPRRFTPGEITPSSCWLGCWVGFTTSLDRVNKRKICCPCRESNSNSSAFITAHALRNNDISMLQ